MANYTIWDISINRNTNNFNGSEWVVDGERGRETYSPDLSKEEVRKLYQEGK